MLINVLEIEATINNKLNNLLINTLEQLIVTRINDSF
jgi:hypothetical protein